MTSRKDYRKENKQGSKFLIIGGVVAIVAIAAGVFGYNAYKREQAAAYARNQKQIAFNKTHFNPTSPFTGLRSAS